MIDGGKMVNIEGSIGVDSYDNKQSADTENTTIQIMGEYYLTNMHSIGVTFSQISGDDNDEKGQSMAVHGNFFLTPKFSVNAEIYQFSGDGNGNDMDRLSLIANLRF